MTQPVGVPGVDYDLLPVTPPKMGDTVTAVGRAVTSNGLDRCPAIITRVWDVTRVMIAGQVVNLITFPDGGMPQARMSVQLFATEAELAEAAGSEIVGIAAFRW